MGITLNPFTGQFDFIGEWIKIKDPISASASSTFDTIPLTDFVHAEYLINYRSQTTDEAKSFKFSVLNDNSVLKDSVYVKMGTNIRVDVSADVNAGNFELNFTNNEIFDVDISVARLVLE